MLQELTAATGAQVWAIASMFFFLLAFLIAAVLVWRTEPSVLEACARLPLAGDEEQGGGESDHSRASSPDMV